MTDTPGPLSWEDKVRCSSGAEAGCVSLSSG